MRLQIDTSKWSGEGAFTQVLIDRLQQMDEVAFLRVEDAPASRSEANYNFISNEIFVRFATKARKQRRFPFLPVWRIVAEKVMTVPGLEQALRDTPEIGAPNYSDQTLLQYLRTERIVPPYQTRGYKLVELVRVYEA